MRPPRSLLAAAALALAAAAAAAQPAPPARVRVDLYAEALCPYCAAFTNGTLAGLFAAGFGDIMEFRYVPWGNARRLENGSVLCQHGAVECALNRVLACGITLLPPGGVGVGGGGVGAAGEGAPAWFPFVRCVEGAEDAAAAVVPCARAAGLDVAALAACAEGDAGEALEEAAEAETAALVPRHTFVPWLVINGIAVGADLDNAGRYVCAAYGGEGRPPACFDPPPDARRAVGSRAPGGAVAR